MPAPLLLLVALAGAQMIGGGHQGHGHVGRPAGGSWAAPVGDRHTFISPMGEPFRVPGGDGLTAWFQQADKNRDGFVTIDEMRADAQRFFLTLDRSKDGEIDPDDVDYYENTIAPEVRGGALGEGGDDEAGGGSRLGVLSIPEPVTTADTNLDRGVSAQEFQVAADKRFHVLDLNGDGRLTLDELQASRSAARAKSRRAQTPQSDPDADNNLPPIGGDSMPPNSN